MNAPEIAIVDYGMGNLFSVGQAVVHAGGVPVITSDPERIEAADGVVLPGVGAMPRAMEALESTGLADAVRRVALSDTPLLGICLGMQLLMETGNEFGEHPGLGVLRGTVQRFPDRSDAGEAIRVPHIGWSPVEPAAGSENGWDADSPLAAIDPGSRMYFVHSYYVVPADDEVVAATSEYEGIRFCAAVRRDNVFGCQFHPERSGPEGLAIYRRFVQGIQQQG